MIFAYNEHKGFTWVIGRIENEFDVMHENWINDIHQLIRMFPPPKKLHEEIISEMFPEEKLIGLTTSEERLEKFNEAVYTLATIWLAYLKQEMEDGLNERNDCMIRTIDQHLPHSSRIFVIAGIAHFTLDQRFSSHLTENNETSVKLVRQYIADKKYVLLYPNANNDNLQQIKDELRPPMGSILRRLVMQLDFCTLAKVILVGPVVCLGFSAVFLPLLIYKKASNYFSASDPYHESLKTLSLEQLLELIAFSAENPESLPRQLGITPLNKVST